MKENKNNFLLKKVPSCLLFKPFLFFNSESAPARSSNATISGFGVKLAAT